MTNSFIGLKHLTFIIAVLLIFGLTACQSRLSSGNIDDISLIGADIKIDQDPYDKNKNDIVIELFDEDGHRISNDAVKIIVNAMEVDIHHKQGLYYNDESSYRLSNVPVDDTYHVEVKLTDRKSYFLAEIGALKEEQDATIDCEEEGDINKDFTLKWNNLKDIDELSVMTSIIVKTKNPNVTQYDSRPDKILKIGSHGSFTVPKSEYIDSTSRISILSFKFTAKRSGKMNPKLARNSEITINTAIERSANFKED
jgi:hypothetical protein